MSRLRTVLALLLHVLLLHASVLGGGMACAPASSGLAGATTERHEHGGQHERHAQRSAHEGVPAGHASAGQGHGDAPAPPSERAPTHCVTAAGCAVAALAVPATVDDTLQRVRSVAAVGRVSLPPSGRPAPETPPPRA
jgi:hypothetical protein